MKLPKKFKEGDVVTFVQGFTTPLRDGGTADIDKGHIARVEKVLYEAPRNGMFNFINVLVVLSLYIGDKIYYISLTGEWAHEVLEIKPAATVLYGDE